MSKYELTGAVRLINDTQTFSSGFAKREFVVETEDGKYPQLIKLECVKDRVKHLDGVRVNDVVNVNELALPETTNSIRASFCVVSVLMVGMMRVERFAVRSGAPVAARASNP